MHFEHLANHRDTARSSTTNSAFFCMANFIRIAALSRATLYRRIAGGKFPPPVHLGRRACGWPRAALRRWIDDPASTQTPQGRIDPRSGSAAALFWLDATTVGQVVQVLNSFKRAGL